MPHIYSGGKKWFVDRKSNKVGVFLVHDYFDSNSNHLSSVGMPRGLSGVTFFRWVIFWMLSSAILNVTQERHRIGIPIHPQGMGPTRVRSILLQRVFSLLQ